MLDKAKFVLSRKALLEKYSEIKKQADIVSYSFKTNYEVGALLERTTDCMFSVHSIQSSKKLNDVERVWFFAQGWDENEINELLNTGISKFVVDNQKDLDVLLRILKNRKNKVDLLLRIRLKENTIHTGKHFVFGFYIRELNELIPLIRKNPKISKLGIHFHRKTQNISEWSLKEELEDSIHKENWKNIDYVNIGGGLPSVYKNCRAEVMDYIFKKIGELKEFLNSKNIQMIIEPGRFIAAPSLKLVAKIKNIYHNNIIINASVYNSAMDTFVANVRLLVEGELEQGIGEHYTIKGCTPDSLDIFRYSVYLQNPKVNDEIVFLNAGAYNFSTDFCNLPKLETEVEE